MFFGIFLSNWWQSIIDPTTLTLVKKENPTASTNFRFEHHREHVISTEKTCFEKILTYNWSIVWNTQGVVDIDDACIKIFVLIFWTYSMRFCTKRIWRSYFENQFKCEDCALHYLSRDVGIKIFAGKLSQTINNHYKSNLQLTRNFASLCEAIYSNHKVLLYNIEYIAL